MPVITIPGNSKPYRDMARLATDTLFGLLHDNAGVREAFDAALRQRRDRSGVVGSAIFARSSEGIALDAAIDTLDSYLTGEEPYENVVEDEVNSDPDVSEDEGGEEPQEQEEPEEQAEVGLPGRSDVDEDEEGEEEDEDEDSDAEAGL